MLHRDFHLNVFVEIAVEIRETKARERDVNSAKTLLWNVDGLRSIESRNQWQHFDQNFSRSH